MLLRSSSGQAVQLPKLRTDLLLNTVEADAKQYLEKVLDQLVENVEDHLKEEVRDALGRLLGHYGLTNLIGILGQQTGIEPNHLENPFNLGKVLHKVEHKAKHAATQAGKTVAKTAKKAGKTVEHTGKQAGQTVAHDAVDAGKATADEGKSAGKAITSASKIVADESKSLATNVKDAGEVAIDTASDLAQEIPHEIFIQVKHVLHEMVSEAARQSMQIAVGLIKHIPPIRYTLGLGPVSITIGRIDEKLHYLEHYAQNFPSHREEIVQMVIDLSPDAVAVSMEIAVPIIDQGMSHTLEMEKEDLIKFIRYYL